LFSYCKSSSEHLIFPRSAGCLFKFWAIKIRPVHRTPPTPLENPLPMEVT